MLWPTPTRAARWTTESTPSQGAPDHVGIAQVPGDELDLPGEVGGSLRVPVHLLDEAVERADSVAGIAAARRRGVTR
jgi:hypothetical protein